MQRALAVLMDPIEKIKIYKDSSFAMLLEAKKRGYALHYLLQDSLYIKDSQACARAQRLDVFGGVFPFAINQNLHVPC